MNQKPNYGNWVPEKLLYLTFGGAALFLVLALLSGLAFSSTPLAVICAILCAVLLAFGIYMYACHECFAFGKGDMMAKVHAHLVAHLNWDGHGTLLDIGCGAAPLTIRCAKAFPDAALIGMDYWGAQWNYAKEQCEKKKPHTEALCLHKSSCVWLLFFIGRMPDSEEKRSFFELQHCGLERRDQEIFFLQPPPRGAEESSLTSAKITTHISTI